LSKIENRWGIRNLDGRFLVRVQMVKAIRSLASLAAAAHATPVNDIRSQDLGPHGVTVGPDNIEQVRPGSMTGPDLRFLWA
jgi:hypothetical protein